MLFGVFFWVNLAIISHWEKWMMRLKETQCKWCVRLYRVGYNASLILHFEVCIYVLLETRVVCKSCSCQKEML